MTKVAFEIAQLLADGLAPFFDSREALRDQSQIIPPPIVAIGAHFLLHPRQRVESIDNRFTDLADLIEQAQSRWDSGSPAQPLWRLL